MTKNTTLGFFLLLVSIFNTTHAQMFDNGSVTTIEGETFSGEILIIQKNKTVKHEVNGTIRHFKYENISSLTLEGQEYEILNPVNHDIEVVSKIVSGKANVYKDLNNNYYLETDNHEARKLNFKSPSQIRGTLAAFFSDCPKVREELNLMFDVKQEEVVWAAEQYNNCSYSESFTITETEILRAKKNTFDVVDFYVGGGMYMNSLKISDGEQGNYSALLLNAGFNLYPFKSATFDNLFISVNFDWLTNSENKFIMPGEGEYTLASSYYQLSAGINYNFRPEGTWQPYAGVAAGISMSDYAMGFRDYMFHIFHHFSDPNRDPFIIINPEIGFKYKLNEKVGFGAGIKYTFQGSSDISYSNVQGSLEVKENTFSATARLYF